LSAIHTHAEPRAQKAIVRLARRIAVSQRDAALLLEVYRLEGRTAAGLGRAFDLIFADEPSTTIAAERARVLPPTMRAEWCLGEVAEEKREFAITYGARWLIEAAIREDLIVARCATTAHGIALLSRWLDLIDLPSAHSAVRERSEISARIVVWAIKSSGATVRELGHSIDAAAQNLPEEFLADPTLLELLANDNAPSLADRIFTRFGPSVVTNFCSQEPAPHVGKAMNAASWLRWPPVPT